MFLKIVLCGIVVIMTKGETAVDGMWGNWMNLDECSITCGTGTHTIFRIRNCPESSFGVADCRRLETETRDCGLTKCPIDGVWGSWTDWSKCSATYGHATQTRSRNCTGPFYGGTDCEGLQNETRQCIPSVCPIDGVWGNWTDWSDCSVTCGHGSQTRSRDCIGPFSDGANCTGLQNETRACNPTVCQINESMKQPEGCGHVSRRRRSRHPKQKQKWYWINYVGRDCAGMYNKTKEHNNFECQRK